MGSPKILSFLTVVLFLVSSAFAGIAPYCNPSAPATDPNYYDGSGWDIGIANVTFGTINNTTAVPTGMGGYGGCLGGQSFSVIDYTNTGTYGTANITQGQSYTLSVKVGDYCGGAPSNVEVWIDWNNDNDFGDANEYVAGVASVAAGTSTNITVNVPCSATAGNRRMRVYSDDAGGLTGDPCSNYYGEMEDYTVNVVSAGGVMVYTTSEVTQTNTTAVAQNSTNQEIIGIKIDMCGSASPLAVDTFMFNTAGTLGTTNATNDIQNAKLWFTGSSASFATTSQMGSTVAAPNGVFRIVCAAQTLAAGSNYFWLTYDVKAGATLNNYVDALCSSVRVGGSNKTPTTTSPTGSRMVDGNMIFTSSTTTQSNTSNVNANSTNNEIMGVQIVTTGSANPLSATAFTFNTTGSTAPATDITNAKLWYTGTSSSFATTSQKGSTVAAPNGTFTINGFSQTLSAGTNYFWLSYDVPIGAVPGNVIDAECTKDSVSGTGNTPTLQNPGTSRSVTPPPGYWYVTNTNSSGAGSYRQAVKDANNDGISPSYIYFNIPGAGVHTITLTSSFVGGANPSEYIITPMIIDGTTQPGYSGTPLIEINGNGYQFPFYVRNGWGGSYPPNTSSTGTTIKGICVNRCGSDGIILEYINSCTVENCYIGIDPTGTIARGNTNNGISLWGLPSTNHIIRNNVISSNVWYGITVANGGVDQILITGNKIGTNAAGTAALGNGFSGIILGSGTGNTIGGTTNALRNIVSGNGGVGISVASGMKVIGNYIGTDVNGTAAIPNGAGATVSANATLGGTNPGEGNIISGNTGYGVGFGYGTGGKAIGNYIGVDITGNVALGNGSYGVTLSGIFTGSNTVGGSTAAERNIISGNLGSGVDFRDWTASNKIWGNYIGVGANGTTAIGNGGHGIRMTQDSTTAVTNSNQIGGLNPACGNIIANNGMCGIYNAGSAFNVYSHNLIYNNASSKAIHHLDSIGWTSPPGHGNYNRLPPTITVANTTTVSGTATAGDSIEVYRSSGTTDASCKNAEVYLGSVKADGSGNWSLAGLTLAGQVIKATARDNSNNNTSEFSPCQTATLPVELYSFDASEVGAGVLVRWSTASEINSDYFLVERSNNAYDWEVLGKINGSGTKNDLTEYSFEDNKPLTGISYYRLRQVDYDSKFEYFGPVSVTVNNREFGFNVFPNPSDGKTTYLSFSGLSEDHKEILVVVYNMEGQELYSKIVITERSKSVLVATDNLSKLPKGIYMVMATSDNKLYKQKLIIR